MSTRLLHLGPDATAPVDGSQPPRNAPRTNPAPDRSRKLPEAPRGASLEGWVA